MNNPHMVVEFLAAFFLGITGLLALMVRLESSLGQLKVAEGPRGQVGPPAEGPPAVALPAER